MRFFLPGMIIFFNSLTTFSQTREKFSVYFEFDRYELTKKAFSQIDSFCRQNKKTIPYLEFEIKGFCDNRGTDHYNDILSEKRVATIKKFLLKRGMNIEFMIAAMGYGETEPLNENKTEEERQLNRRVDINIRNNEAALPDKEEPISLKQKIADSTTRAGTNIILNNINFVGGLHQLLPESIPVLNELLEAMLANPELVIRVEGHICCQLDKADGTDLETGIENLSEARANAVMDYLLSKGIASKRVSAKGFGHSAPLYPYPEKSEIEMSQNRRVEIKIISK